MQHFFSSGFLFPDMLPLGTCCRFELHISHPAKSQGRAVEAQDKFRTGRLCVEVIGTHVAPRVRKTGEKGFSAFLSTISAQNDFCLKSITQPAPCLVWVTEPNISVEESSISIPAWQPQLLGQSYLQNTTTVLCTLEQRVSSTTCSQGPQFLARAASIFFRYIHLSLFLTGSSLKDFLIGEGHW